MASDQRISTAFAIRSVAGQWLVERRKRENAGWVSLARLPFKGQKPEETEFWEKTVVVGQTLGLHSCCLLGLDCQIQAFANEVGNSRE